MSQKLPKVAIIIINFNGKKIVKDCLDSLCRIKYPKNKLEIIIVDNGSRDGSVGFIKNNYPTVKVFPLKKNTGFASPNNYASRRTKSKYVVFLNNDMRVDQDWLISLVRSIGQDKRIATVSSKILSWDGKKIDHGGSDSDIFMNARLEGYGEKNKKGVFNKEQEILFPSGGSMIIERKLFLDVGGFDSDFFAYYEDVDLGVRLKLLGYKNYFNPQSIVFHHHAETSKKLPVEKIRVLQIRNVIWIIIKNFSDENLGKFLAPALILSLQRTFSVVNNFRSKKYNFLKIKYPDKKKIPLHVISRKEMILLSDLLGYSDIIEMWGKFLQKREAIQSKRKINDEELFKLMKSKFIPIIKDKEYAKLYNVLLKTFKLYNTNE